MTPLPLPPEIRLENLPDGVRYLLPVRPLNFFTVVHVILGAVGLLLISFPFLPALLMGGLAAGDFRWQAVGFFLVCPGAVTIPLGLFLLCYSLLLLFGRVDLRLTPTHLVGTLRVGPLMGWTRLRLDEIRGFRVEAHQPTPANADSTVETLASSAAVANLKAERSEERTSWVVYAYPGAWLDLLAAELTARLAERGQALSLETRRLDPTEIYERPEQPPESTAIFSESGDGLAIDLPARGLWRGNPKFVILFTVLWNLMVWPFTIGLLFAAAAGQVDWERGRLAAQGLPPEKTSVLFVLAFSTPFWAVAVALILWLRHNAVKRTRIRIRPDRLTVEAVGVFGTSQRHWNREQIRSLRALTVSDEKDGMKVWTTGLHIMTLGDEESFLFHDRPRTEVEWIATTVRRTMKITDPVPQEQGTEEQAVEAATPEPVPAAPAWQPKRLVLQGLLALVLFLCGWEWRSGYDQAGNSSTLYFGPVFFFAEAPQAKDLPEAKQHAGVAVQRWYLGGTYRTSSSTGKVR